ncbi:MAG TPA: type II secretion system protein [Tepidisphaeraceae bacterium]|jgi:prepilin-type N-terminal cleavage/methylation domain-containing protein|nr:type II secretion system protein [Tepidisphaeraceae bacterium]
MRNAHEEFRLAAGLARRSVAGASDSPGRQIGEQARRLHQGVARVGNAGAFRRGFSFVELLFAIMILGIGFIMIAAIFPVAIRQTAVSGEETVASTIAKSAVGVIQQFASNTTMPTTNGKVVPIGPTAPTGESAATLLWAAINGNMILPSDNRYAWSAMYERDAAPAGGAVPPYAQVIIIGMQVRNRTQYSASTPGGTNLYGDVGFVTASNLPSQPNLQPKQVQVQFTMNGPSAPDTVTFLTPGNTPESYNASAVAEGSYLVIDDDGGSGNRTFNSAAYQASYPNATCNGFVYKIGNNVSGNMWELVPGNDVYSQINAPVRPTNGVTMNALIVGRSIHDPSQGYGSGNAYEGLSQDISIYVGFVRINS